MTWFEAFAFFLMPGPSWGSGSASITSLSRATGCIPASRPTEPGAS